MGGLIETVDDIIAEQRGYAHGFSDSMRLPMSFGTFRRILNRIEKAHRWELQRRDAADRLERTNQPKGTK